MLEVTTTVVNLAGNHWNDKVAGTQSPAGDLREEDHCSIPQEAGSVCSLGEATTCTCKYFGCREEILSLEVSYALSSL
jgi:hypothetical protein